ncbi:MAG: PIG-L deacetylase family protein [Planctomycetota bacterium]|jgi:LmbE family N-acetylglucosaminyl deacetylase
MTNGDHMNAFQSILVLAPHTDDGELGCGGTITRFVEDDRCVYYVAFSTARTSVRPEFPDNILEIEVKAATQVLGIPSEHLVLCDFPVRHFPEHRQAILQRIIDVRDQINPDLVLVPSLHDIHQDHQVIAAEALRAFKQHTLLGYELPWNNIVFETRCFVTLQERHIARKVEALHRYKSQAHRSYLSDEFVWSQARMRGTQIEGEYAEAFEVLRWVMR